MKKVILTLVVAIFVASTSFAQSKHHKGQKPDFTPEQKVKLMIKKMALSLDLSTSQQQKLKPILLEANAQREEAKKEFMANKEERKNLSSDEKFSMMNEMLDKKLAFQAKMKKVLNDEQFDKWKRISSHRAKAMKGRKKGEAHGKKGKGKRKSKRDHKKHADNA